MADERIRYDLLEAPGRYFDGETAAARDVIVKFGNATLVLMNARGTPIAHWSLAGLRHVGEKGRALTLTPDYQSDERLTVDDPVMNDAIRSVCPDLHSAPAGRPSRWPKVIGWSAAAMASIYLIIFHLIPALADRLAVLIPPDAEVAMGEEMVEQFADLLTEGEHARFCSSPGGDRALASMTNSLAAHAESHVPLTVRVLDHEMINAFALPGGQIVLFEGLLREAESPEEVAGVLAHEIGHVVARDPTRLTLRSAGSAGILGLILGDFTGATVTVALSEALLRSGYQRGAEAEADAFATKMLAEEGLPSAPFAGFFLKLKEKFGDGPKLLTHLSTHPDLAGRAEATKAADTVGDAPFTPVLTDQEWVALRNICQ